MSSQLSHRKRNAEIDKLDGVGISLNMTSGDALQGVERGSAGLPSSFGKTGSFGSLAIGGFWSTCCGRGS